MTTPPTTTPLSGEQFTLVHGGYSATIAAVGATLRELTHEGRNLVVPFDADEIRPLYRGAMLAPWPNRIVDGRYTWGGIDYQVPVNEVARSHALHGLVAWSRWTSTGAAASTGAEASTDATGTTAATIPGQANTVTLQTEVVPTDGYPFPLRIEATFTLDDTGLSTTVTTTNVGESEAPYGVAPHPYLSAGAGRVDDWTLTLDAESYLEVTEDRLIPVATRPVVSDPSFDFRQPTLLGDRFVDHALTGLARDGAGVARATLVAADGHGVQMTWGAELPWVQVHTADRPEPEYDRLGLAVEPMTCPPDAFNSGSDVVALAPGSTHTAAWTISAL